MNTYLIISVIIFLFLAYVWTRDTWYNFLIKLIFTSMGVVGIALLLQQYNFIIVTPK